MKHGEDAEHFHRVASRLLLTALVFLGPGMAGDLFLVIAKVTQSPHAAGASAGLLLTAFYVLWFGVSVWRRKSCLFEPNQHSGVCHLAASA
jgi:hypothetical protein